MLGNYSEETAPLFKLLKTEAFRFVIVRYNHYSIVQQLEKDLKAKFPDRPSIKVDAQKTDYQTLTNAYFELKRGFMFVENFDNVLKQQLDSRGNEPPEFKSENERKRGITAGLNLRRDRFAKYPIAIFVFVPATAGELFAKTIMEKMPDLWSFRSLILDIEIERDDSTGFTAKGLNSATELEEPYFYRTLLNQPVEQKQDTDQYNYLTTLLTDTPQTEIAYRLTLYPQIIDAAIKIGFFDKALHFLEEWEITAPEADKGTIWLQKGDVLTTIGEIDQALPVFENAYRFFEKAYDKYQQGVALERLGTTYSSLGNFDKALGYFEEMGKLFQELNAAYPDNVLFKNGLAHSYIKLSTIHSNLGNLEKALEFTENRTRLFEQLYQSHPANVSYKTILQGTYQFLGDKYSKLGNLEKALHFFELSNQLCQEFFQVYPKDLNYKNKLALSYSKLGDIQYSLGNMGKALGFLEKYQQLCDELYQSNPDNKSYKYSLAISFAKLGEYFHQQNQAPIARQYLEQAADLFQELVRQAHLVVDYQHKLTIVQELLNTLN